jgi:hypothetical protein
LHLYFEVNVHPNCYSTLCHWYRMQMAASLPVMQPQREVVWNPGIEPKQRWYKVFWRGSKPKALWSSQAYLKNLLGSKQDVVHAHQTNYYTDSLSQLRSGGPIKATLGERGPKKLTVWRIVLRSSWSSLGPASCGRSKGGPRTLPSASAKEHMMLLAGDATVIVAISRRSFLSRSQLSTQQQQPRRESVKP